MSILYIERDAVTKDTDFNQDIALRKAIDATVGKAEQDDNGTPILSFVMSTPDVDRDNDTIAVDGWLVENFMKSGNMIWAHDGSLPPIGRPLSVSVENGALMCRMLMTPDSLNYELGTLVTRMYQADFLRGVSVGFRPMKMAFNEERGSLGMDFFEQELIELSGTPIPANPNAMHVMRSLGVNTKPLLDWTERALDESWGQKGSVWVPAVKLAGSDGETKVKAGREIVEEMFTALGGEKKTVQIPDCVKDLSDKIEELNTRLINLEAENKQLKCAEHELEVPVDATEPVEVKADKAETEKEDIFGAWIAEKQAESEKKSEEAEVVQRAIKAAFDELRMETTGRLPAPK